MDWSTWGPTLLTAIIGLAAGAAVVVRVRGAASEGESPDSLAGRKDAIMDELRELESDRAKLGEEEYAADRERAVAEAAAILREIEDRGASSGAGAWGSLVLLLLGIVAAGLAAWVVVVWPGEPPEPTAFARATSTEAAQATNPHAAGGTTSADLPEDLDTLNRMTWQAIQAGDLQTAMVAMGKAGRIDPDDPYVLTHRGILRLSVGMDDGARQVLGEALEAEPGLPRALLWMGIVETRAGDTEAARALYQQVIASSPASEEAPVARELLADLDQPAGKAP